MLSAVVNKYQFFITYKKGVLASAASKPVVDSSKTLKALGYRDYSLTFDSNVKTPQYYLKAISGFIKFFFQLKKNSVVATQSPIPTVSYLLKYFIPLAKLRGIKFITLVHDIDSLRLPGVTDAFIKKEIELLNQYNGIIVHNEVMKGWLIKNRLKKDIQIVPLLFFDYLTPDKILNKREASNNNEIAFAGHLAKSAFIYNLHTISSWSFNIYGGEFNETKNKNVNTSWKGEFAPDDIAFNLQGSFGLVWDGADSSNISTNRFGTYMMYNNPFKFSLYLAAGLPILAPKSAAIATTIKKYNIGFLIENLNDLDNITISNIDYDQMKQNVKALQKRIIAGHFLRDAVTIIEQAI